MDFNRNLFLWYINELVQNTPKNVDLVIREHQEYYNIVVSLFREEISASAAVHTHYVMDASIVCDP